MGQTITDYDLQAFVDGELSAEEEHYVLAHINSEFSTWARYEQLKIQKKILQAWWLGGGWEAHSSVH